MSLPSIVGPRCSHRIATMHYDNNHLLWTIKFNQLKGKKQANRFKWILQQCWPHRKAWNRSAPHSVPPVVDDDGGGAVVVSWTKTHQPPTKVYKKTVCRVESCSFETKLGAQTVCASRNSWIYSIPQCSSWKVHKTLCGVQVAKGYSVDIPEKKHN